MMDFESLAKVIKCNQLHYFNKLIESLNSTNYTVYFACLNTGVQKCKSFKAVIIFTPSRYVYKQYTNSKDKRIFMRSI